MSASIFAEATLWAATVTPSPDPTDLLRPDLSATDVSPGLAGFLAIFGLALVAILGWRSMNRKIRRLRFQERAALEEAATGTLPDAEASDDGVSDAAPDDAAPDDAAPDDAAPDTSEGSGPDHTAPSGV